MNRNRPISFKLASGLLSIMPHRMLYFTAMGGGFIHYLLAGEKRKHYKFNTSALTPAGGMRLRGWKAFQNHALNVLEVLRVSTAPALYAASRITITGREYLDNSLQSGKGLIVTTGHFGNWELSGIALAAQGYPITTVAGEQLTGGWSDEIKNLKRKFGIRVFSPGLEFRSLYRDLEANRILVLHIDGDLFTRGLGVPFLGRQVNFPRGPARLSRIMQAPIAFAYCLREKRDRLKVSILKPMAAPGSEAEEDSLTRALIKKLEETIVDYPEQWCIFRRM